MTEKAKRRTVADADAEISELESKLARVPDLENEITDLRAIIAERDSRIETLQARVVTTAVEREVTNLNKICEKYKAGLYVAVGHSMYNGETKQTFSVSTPIKVSADQLKTSWFLLQLAHKTIAPYEG
jgi:hypothetical protein